jgi:BirA family biotin operon repressor/biotin-[acetyl-CoA-carboxylase] ligase
MIISRKINDHVPAGTITPQMVRRFLEEEETYRSQLMPADEVRKVMRYGGMVGCRIEHYEQIERGMELARQLIAAAEEKGTSLEDGTVILADRLTGGKGRFQRTWHAPQGGIWLTLVLANTLLPEFSRFYTLTAGIACCELLQFYQVDAKLKWINDLLVDGRKTGGILAETHSSPLNREEYVLVGIGINVNNQDFPEELADTATSVKTVLGRPVDISEMTGRLLAKLAWNLGMLRFEEEKHLAEHFPTDESRYGRLAPLLLERWKELSDTIGRKVSFGFDVQNKQLFNAIVVDIDQQGGIVLQHEDGTTSTEHSGEIIYRN